MPSDNKSDTHTFHLLTVCTGNICRSPVAERLLSEGLGATVTVSSAGTYAMVGEPISAPMLPLLIAAGVPGEGFVARQLTEAIVRSADLVLGMTRDHRAAAVDLRPAAVRRTFTLLEFARLLKAVNTADLPDGTVAERLRAAIPLAAAQRRQVRFGAKADDIADPYRGSDADYAIAFGQIRDSVATIIRFVAGASRSST